MSTEARRTRPKSSRPSARPQVLVARSPQRSPCGRSQRPQTSALGLIHRYVGSKDDVIALVLDRHDTPARAVLASAQDLDDLLDPARLLAAPPHRHGPPVRRPGARRGGCAAARARLLSRCSSSRLRTAGRGTRSGCRPGASRVPATRLVARTHRSAVEDATMREEAPDPPLTKGGFGSPRPMWRELPPAPSRSVVGCPAPAS